MTTRVELVALDAEGGLAVAKVMDDWFIVSMDAGWNLEPVTTEAALRSIVFGDCRAVHAPYPSVQALQESVRSQCLMRMPVPTTTYDDIQHLDPLVDRERVTPTGAEQAAPPQPTVWIADETGERRYLTPDARARALTALRALRKESGAEEPASVLGPRIAPSGLSWEILRRRIIRSGRQGSRTWRETNELAAHLLQLGVDSISTLVPPADPVTEGRGASAVGDRLQISCPHRIADHRAVILGQLPWAGLFPAAFINSDDGSDEWYPQVGRGNPLRLGAAFACFAHFGNLNDISEARETRYRVRVCALERRWEFGADRIKGKELAAHLTAMGLVGSPVDVQVLRGVPLRVSISDRDHGQLWNQPTGPLKCVAPVHIVWRGTQQARIEVRARSGNRLVWDGDHLGAVVITLRGRATGHEAQAIELPQAGVYQVRLFPFPLDKPFVDPLSEWWLDVR